MEQLLTLYSEVQSTDVRWLWYPFIAIGKITLLQGDPGDGKSTMMMNLIAELSTGGETPDSCKIGTPQKVIYQCSEDGVSDTIKPRLERCGADCKKIAFINEEVYNGLTLDDERIRQAIIEFRPRLVVIDPIQAYLGSDSDLQIAGRARKLMRRLGMWAAGYDCAIVLIGHLNKKEGSKGLYRSLGSIDVVAAARSVLQVERDTENSDIRIVHGEIIVSSIADHAEIIAILNWNPDIREPIICSKSRTTAESWPWISGLSMTCCRMSRKVRSTSAWRMPIRYGKNSRPTNQPS